MSKKNNNGRNDGQNDGLSNIFDFFEALFGACMPEDRKPQKANNRKNEAGQKPNDLFGNFINAFTVDEKEQKGMRQDLGHITEQTYDRDGLGRKADKAAEFLTGQKLPGGANLLLSAVPLAPAFNIIPLASAEVSPINKILQEETRSETITRLRDFSNSHDDYLGHKAGLIAEELEKKDELDIYIHLSLAGATRGAGLDKKDLEILLHRAENQKPPENQKPSTRISGAKAYPFTMGVLAKR